MRRDGHGADAIADKGVAHWLEDDTVYKMWEDLLQITDPKACDAQRVQAGEAV